MKNNKDILLSVCNWVRRYNASSNETPSDLYKETNYSNYHEQITEQQIELILKDDPKLLDLWETFSMDKRWTPAWYYINRDNGKFEVGYYHHDPKKKARKLYQDPFKACAFFIKMEMEEFRKMNS